MLVFLLFFGIGFGTLEGCFRDPSFSYVSSFSSILSSLAGTVPSKKILLFGQELL
jgi:hypothetical protein